MFSIDLVSPIQFLVDTLLDRRSSEIRYGESSLITRPGLYIRFPIEVRDGYDGNREYTHVHMVFSGRTSVWYQVMPYSSSGVTNSRQWDKYTNSSNHDSCWRSDGFQFLSQTYFEMCEMVNPNKPPIELESESSWMNWTRVSKCDVIYKPTKNGKRCLVDVDNIKNI